MATDKHTTEPWTTRALSMSLDIHVETARGNRDPIIAAVNGYGRDHEVAQANARRIIACVNACAGIPTEALESGKLRRSLDHVADLLDEMLRTVADNDTADEIDAALVALAQLRGEG